MMQSVRERNSEFAVLKTLGFSDGGVLAIVLAESTVLCALGAALGLTFAKFLMPLARQTIGIATIPPVVVAEGVLAALLVALFSGLLPALRARRLSIVDALGGR
jgi:putative ABC transport system permease protein